MKMKQRRFMAGNMKIDQFLVKNPKPQKQAPTKIKVPQCSGYPPSSWPVSNILKYPKNPQIRHYQQQIVMSCVCENTLVCLPTGLGKTHIAAVLIANFINWFPDKKVLFLAPTRPLVRQQVSALDGLRQLVPEDLILEVSGQLAAKKREQLYNDFRVIFGTPQTLENDLKTDKLDKNSIILLIFDECHRSVGEASYAKIVRLLADVQVGFRIIGLSATPGHQPQRVQSVISNLNLCKVIYKDDKDPQVKRYLNEKEVHQIQVKSNDIITEASDILNDFARPSSGLLIKYKLVSPWLLGKGIKNTSFFLVREQFQKNIENIDRNHKAVAYAGLKVIGFLMEARKCLTERGFESFKNHFFGSLRNPIPPNAQKQNKEETNSVRITDDSSELMYYQQNSISNGFSIPQYSQDRSQNTGFSYTANNDSNKPGELPAKFQAKMVESVRYKRLYEIFHTQNVTKIHPKLQKLIEVLRTFFSKNNGRTIVFTNFRATAKQIQNYLSHVSQIKSQLFFGQSKTIFKQGQDSTSILYLKQSQQLKIIQKFKAGEVNTLISTSIGEEGLDIGQVDCIICYDGGHSPIRAIQRRGRTGRKRAGVVYYLLMEGKEWEDYKKGGKKEQKMKNMLTRQLHKFNYYGYNSPLFQEKTQIIVELFDNQIHEPSIMTKKAKGQEKKSKDQKQTKKRTKKVSANSDSQDKQISQSEFELKTKSLSQLLSQYCSCPQEKDMNMSFDSALQSDEQKLQVHSAKCAIIQEEDDHESPPKQQINYEHMKPMSEKECFQPEEEDEDILMFEMYLASKKQEISMSMAPNQPASDSDSLNSDEFIEIMSKVQQRRQLHKLIESDDQS